MTRSIELPRDFCAGIGPLQLGVVLVFYIFIITDDMIKIYLCFVNKNRYTIIYQRTLRVVGEVDGDFFSWTPMWHTVCRRRPRICAMLMARRLPFLELGSSDIGESSSWPSSLSSRLVGLVGDI